MHDPSRRAFVAAAFLAFAIFSCGALWAAEGTSLIPARRIALRGYDPVSYFTEGRPQKGTNEFLFAFDDAIYLFTTDEHRAIFSADPERYAPQFAGFCTRSLSRGEKVEADPEAWTIFGGRLYVFGSEKSLSDFGRDPGSIASEANATWRKLQTAQ